MKTFSDLQAHAKEFLSKADQLNFTEFGKGVKDFLEGHERVMMNAQTQRNTTEGDVNDFPVPQK